MAKIKDKKQMKTVFYLIIITSITWNCNVNRLLTIVSLYQKLLHFIYKLL